MVTFWGQQNHKDARIAGALKRKNTAIDSERHFMGRTRK